MIIPYRNEGDNLTKLLNALLNQNFLDNKLDIILVDDHSDDGGPELVREFCASAGAGKVGEQSEVSANFYLNTNRAVKLLSLRDHLAGKLVVAHKKAALNYGIANTDSDVILTTDADCLPPPGWLARVVNQFQPGTDIVCGPVWIAPERTFCDQFQALDLTAYQFLTATSIAKGTPTLANGACFAFRKSAFEAVGGYAGVDHLPSGDDVLLLHKFTNHFPAGSFKWLGNGPVVTTRPVAGWRALWRQRLRWAGKAGHYQAQELKFAQALTFLTCLSLLALIPISLHLRSVAPLLILWSCKAVVDWLNLRAIHQHYGKKLDTSAYLKSALLYPFFLVAVGSAALLGLRADWKGRTY
ncbi:glycosyltransferase [Neolewinella antarctica]|uniref:Cellulose synthase/poly-beta-1,6-N-acetylglucosamine synthase-like glycosyltransferase n=1 Tax=Neolewinella antarctica TaxID=442734 RepID=A0ABX0X7K4_9BACT|nr:glycosyltransferase [Neolewinella antarctica]NJC24959.1 cellulose synthase/poly-beta-1,6-N-acetylglucosamine synthase-like glycosyltransferase [Neolewinella antarctica]